MVLDLLVDTSKGVFGKELSSTDTTVIGSQGLRRYIHHHLMKRAVGTHERGIGTTFIFPERTAAINLGRSSRQGEYGRFSLDIYRITRLRCFRDIKNERKLLGDEVHRTLMNLRGFNGALRDNGRFTMNFDKPYIEVSDIPKPRRVYVTTVTLTVSKEFFRGPSRDTSKEFYHDVPGRTLYGASHSVEAG